MRPSCDKILEMPIVRKRIEKLFPQDTFYESQSSLLNTIRVPKNLLYLTDRLPKPSYNSPTHLKKMEEEERNRRKTHGGDGGAQMLPDIKNQKKAKQAIGERDHISNNPAPTGNQSGVGPHQGSSHSGIRIKKQSKQIRGRSEMRDGS